METGAKTSYCSQVRGQWVESGNDFEVVNPANAQPFARVSAIDRSQLKDALRCAEESLPAWRATTARERGLVLHRIADQIVLRKAEIARIITLENGKPLAQSEGELAMCEDQLRWFAEEGRRAYGRTIPPQVHGKRHLVVKTPIGTIGAIAPWNFPLSLAVRKIAPAMAAGCPVILKPASQTPSRKRRT